MSRKSIRSARHRAFRRQAGRCYYCGFPMWQTDPASFARLHGLSPGTVRPLQCTAEHLVARCDGGSDEGSNIVSACACCNRRRHARKRPLAPDAFGALVSRRLASQRWHPGTVMVVEGETRRR